MNFTQTQPVPTVTPPPRTLEQRMAALAIANEKRFHRAEVKRDLAARRVGLAAVIDDPLFDTAKVYDVLCCLPRYGRVRAFKLVNACGISPGKTCATLTPKQRRALFSALGPLTQRDDA